VFPASVATAARETALDQVTTRPVAETLKDAVQVCARNTRASWQPSNSVESHRLFV